MNVERRWLGTSVVRIRILVAGLVLLGAGCAFLGWGARSRQTAANVAVELLSRPETPATVPSLLTTGLSGDVNGGAESRARALFAGMPLIFEPNQGQANLDPADPRAKFLTHGSGYSLFLGSEGAILSLVSRDSKASAAGLREAPRVPDPRGVPPDEAGGSESKRKFDRR